MGSHYCFFCDKNYSLSFYNHILGQSTEEEFVDQLEQNMSNPDQLIHVLERLKVSLSTYYISWVQKFAEKGGHRKLNRILNKWNQPGLNDESEYLIGTL